MLKIKVFAICFLLCIAVAQGADSQRKGFQPSTTPNPSANPFGSIPRDNKAAKPSPSKGGNIIEEDGWDDFAPPPPTGNSGASGGGFGGSARGSFGGGFGGSSNSSSNAASLAQAFPIQDIESGNGDEKIPNFDFPDTELQDIVKAMGKLTGKNFILNNDLKGKRISILTYGVITVKDAWRAFLTALEINSMTLVRAGEYLRIMPVNDAKDNSLRIYSGETPNTSAFVISVMKLNHISASDLSNLLRQMTTRYSRYISFDQTNAIIAIDTASNIKRVHEMVKLLDTSGHEEKLEVIKIYNTNVSDIANLLDSLIPDVKSNSTANRFRSSFGAANSSTGFTRRQTTGGGVISLLVPYEATNSLLVKANAKGMAEIREILERIDVKGASDGVGKINVVYIKYGDAEKISQTLNNLSQGGGDSRFPSLGASAAAKKPGSASLFEGSVKVSVDKDTNSLVITASPSDYKTMKAVIEKLDIPRDQVYVEALIMEVNMNRTKDFAAGIMNPASGLSSIPRISDLADILSGAPTGGAFVFSKGATRTVETKVGDTVVKKDVSGFNAFLKYVQTNAIGNLLATPQLMAIDNQDATIKITDKIFIEEVTALGNSTTPVKSSKPFDIPLILKVKPMISKKSDNIKLSVELTFQTKVDGATGSSISIGIASREAITTVQVKDQETIVLGGLIKDTVNESESKVPLLGDLPIIGWLFKQNKKEIVKSNLVVFLTPRIIRSKEDNQGILKRKIKQREDFIENETSGLDIKREDMNRIKKSALGDEAIKKNNKKNNAKVEHNKEEVENVPAIDEDKKEDEIIPHEEKKDDKKSEGGVAPLPTPEVPPPLDLPSSTPAPTPNNLQGNE